MSTPTYSGQLSSALAFGVGAGISPIQFWNGSPSSAKMTILENGNVGIGTTTPTYPLDVNGTARANTLWAFNTTLSATLGQFSSNGSAGWVFSNQGGGNGSVAFKGYLANDLKIFMNPEGSSYINSGNVGIGT